MPDIKSVFSEEIRRLAKKEVKLAIEPLQKTISDQRHLIVDLKRRISALEAGKVAAPKVVPGSEEAIAELATKKIRLNAAGIVRIRKKLKLTQAEFAALLGVAPHTVSIWEIGKVSPRQNAKIAICSLRSLGKRALKERLASLAPVPAEAPAEAPAPTAKK